MINKLINISASIVIYNEKEETLRKVIESYLKLPFEKELVIVDNSNKNYLESVCKKYPLQYVFANENLGFGKGHNLAFNSLQKKSEIHLILNPDIYFDAESIGKMINWFHHSKDLSVAVPAVCYPNGDFQFTTRKIPTFESLFKRRFNLFGAFNDYIKKDELGQTLPRETTDIPFAHGCFLMFKSNVYEKIEGFDEQFFMYMEDADIFIRARGYGKTVINPDFKIFHEHRKSSYKNLRLLFTHIISAFKFFLKHSLFK